MKAAKLIVLLAGVLGILAFFVPIAKWTQNGSDYSVSVFQLFGAAEVGQQLIDKAPVEGATDQQKQDIKSARESLNEIKGILVACFLPGMLLALIGLAATVRRRYGRMGGLLAIVLGLLSFLVFMGFNALADSGDQVVSKGAGVYLLAATGLLGMAGGALALVNPDRGPEGKKA